jgi:D-beta-D-heptose 7-phosphate kinase/D-beta-D-heptose 1-phosphate adenosyltransferase
MRWRRQNLTVGFTNGCFDLLHLGHLHLLNQCKTQCDRLIVAINTDASVGALKGPSRPIQNEQVRSHVLSALEVVNAVILFGDETPLQLITTILPDVLIKGADYTVDTVVGGDVVMKNGGRVYLAELKEGQSTTHTVSRMKAAG